MSGTPATPVAAPAPRPGPAGRLALAFVDSALTPLLLVASVLLGAFAVLRLPREEEPQIVVPMVDVMAALPSAPASEVEERVAKPLEKLLWEVPGVEYLYTTSHAGSAFVIVRFRVGEDLERSLVRLDSKIRESLGRLPPGVSTPLVVPRSIDDVPVLALTVWSRTHGDAEIRRVAAELLDVAKQVPELSEAVLLGGGRRELRVLLDPERLTARGVPARQAAAAVRGENGIVPAGTFAAEDRESALETGRLLATAGDVADVVVGAGNSGAVHLRDVARVEDGVADATALVRFSPGPAHAAGPAVPGHGGAYPAVTLSLAKRKGANAVAVAGEVLRRVAVARPRLLPAGMEIEVTRNFGETAREKSNELLEHMALAVLSVALLVGFALGRRAAGIVLLAVPATLALTLAVFLLYGYTLNRITLFALIFSIGILVDDAIVVVENIARHRALPGARGRSASATAVLATDEVGNPTILATLTVMAAILPMAFVGGLMGPYMRPIPVGASAAMLFSLLVAFIVTPWAAVRLLGHGAHGGEGGPESRSTRAYRRAMTALVTRRGARRLFLAAVAVLLALALALVPLGAVRVKMLPFDNKSELRIVLDMPEGTTLESTSGAALAMADKALAYPEVRSVTTYIGTSAPYDFSGLVRHEFLRAAPHQATVQVSLVGKGERKIQSHAFARRLRTSVEPLARALGARIQVAEAPPGPPVLQTLVAEVYGPDPARRAAIAGSIKEVFEATPGIVDVDWWVEDEQPRWVLAVDREKAALSGARPDDVAATVRLGAGGETLGLLHDPRAREDVAIVMRLSRADRSSLERIGALPVSARGGGVVRVGDLTARRLESVDRRLDRKNLMPVTYVTADVAGTEESPVYAIAALAPRIAALDLGLGYPLEQRTASQPDGALRYALKWDGEWHITYEVFRDLGLAFAAVLVLIYLLVVGWFQSFKAPVVIMSAIPFSLVGILPAHALLGAFFTATSMIGFIAGAGIVVRNSIILVDFIELRRREGRSLEEAVVDAGAVRFRPMLLTASAVVVGASVILFDPIFQGLAISLMAGEVASLFLSRVTVPVVYVLLNRDQAAQPKEVTS